MSVNFFVRNKNEMNNLTIISFLGFYLERCLDENQIGLNPLFQAVLDRFGII